MRILWWNLGHAYLPWVLHGLFHTPVPGYSPFYDPADAAAVRAFVAREHATVFTACEVEEKDAEGLRPEGGTIGYSPTPHGPHGRIVATTERAEMKDGYADFGDFAIVPLHLHWGKPDVRLAQTEACIALCTSIGKPVIVVGDLNIWSFFWGLVPFRDDRRALAALRAAFIEKTKHIISTEAGLPVRLDYVFASREIADRVTVTKPGSPLPALDHEPLLIELARTA